MRYTKIEELGSDIQKYYNKKIDKNSSDELNKCFRRIVILVNYRERCVKELRNRLVDREKFNIGTFNKAIDKAIRYNFVDDDRYAEIYCFSKINCKRGT